MAGTANIYRGRFAPSPSGPLHFGSLVAAVGSFLEARTHRGQWLLRMEDIDPPREQPGAAAHILQTLETYGFEWDSPVLYQSTRSAAYESAISTLREHGMLYPCACSRKEVADSALRGIEGPVYAGTCRNGLHGRKIRAWRIRTDAAETAFEDALQGRQAQALQRDIGNFILKRADGLYAYQLAVVIDDAFQGITHIVRGSDLLDSTPRQIYLQHRLDLPTPHYAHLPVAVNAQGEKLSKQTLAPPLDTMRPATALWHALAFLHQQPPAGLMRAPVAELWTWALRHWQAAHIPQVKTLPAPDIV